MNYLTVEFKFALGSEVFIKSIKQSAIIISAEIEIVRTDSNGLHHSSIEYVVRNSSGSFLTVAEQELEEVKNEDGVINTTKETLIDVMNLHNNISE